MTLNFGFDFYLGLSRLIMIFSLVGVASTLFWLFMVICDGVEGFFVLLVTIITFIALFGIFFLH
jgi:hypothetical protein